jgi:choline kinase
MKAIFIGAGRGSRLMPHTEDQPKCFADVGGRRIIDWIVEAMREGGASDQVFVGGYLIEMVQQDYGHFDFRHNADWPNNNILGSLFHAEDCMGGGFICSYVDILYRPSVVRGLLEHPADIVIAVDTDWESRYEERSQHPPDDAEKVRVVDGRVVEIARNIPTEDAHGEYIGVAKFSPAGAEQLRSAYNEAKARSDGQPYRSAASFLKAYLIDLFQEMIESGVDFGLVETHGDYMEIDTQEDYDLARRDWR